MESQLLEHTNEVGKHAATRALLHWMGQALPDPQASSPPASVFPYVPYEVKEQREVTTL